MRPETGSFLGFFYGVVRTIVCKGEKEKKKKRKELPFRPSSKAYRMIR